MELWIRSQSKKILEKAEMIKIVKYENNNLYSIVVNNDYIFGEYQTEKRALEVLDKIQKYILLPNTDNSSYVYEMPKE